MRFKDKKVLVTGGSRGIGKATVLAFAKEGAKVAIVYGHNDDAAKNTLSALAGEGHQLFKTELSNTSALEELMDTVHTQFGELDVLVNNAGVAFHHEVDVVDYKAWQDAWNTMMALNIVAPAHLSYLAAKEMQKKGGGKIVNVSSRGAFRGEPQMPAYGASKAALNAMTQSLAKALGKDNIHVSAVAPGFVETDMAKANLTEESRAALIAENPMNRLAQAEEVANAILFLASDQATYCTGTILDVNGASYLR